MPEIPDELDTAIEELAAAPQQVNTDGLQVTERPLSELIAFDQWRKAKEAQRSGKSGLKFFRTVPPGSV